MRALCDSSVLIASLLPSEDHHAACAALLNGIDTIVVHVHALNETFATLTGGSLGFRVDANLAARLIRERIMTHASMIVLDADDVTARSTKLVLTAFVAARCMITCTLSQPGKAMPMCSTH